MQQLIHEYLGMKHFAKRQEQLISAKTRVVRGQRARVLFHLIVGEVDNRDVMNDHDIPTQFSQNHTGTMTGSLVNAKKLLY